MATSKKKYVFAVAKDKRGRRISTAENNYKKTHPIQKYFAKITGEPKKEFLHAEILALLRAGEKEVYSLDVSSTPCTTCFKAMSIYGLNHCTYFNLQGEKLRYDFIINKH